MFRITLDPPTLPPRPGPFVQTVRLLDDDRILGTATWHTTGQPDGTAQLLDLVIEPGVRRTGLGKRLLRAVLDACRDQHRSRSVPFRRLWVGVPHKSQVVCRAFITGQGFHHLASASDLFGTEDLLIYIKSLD